MLVYVLEVVATMEIHYMIESYLYYAARDNCTHGEVRLLFGSSEMEGTVEICINGYWGTICDNGWDSRDAGVICRQLGYSSFGTHAIILPFV